MKKVSIEEHLATQLHLMLCEKTHTYDVVWLANLEDCPLCTWYLEEQISECWDLRQHLIYKKALSKILPQIKKELVYYEDCEKGSCEPIEIG